ncbi:hypothetical protein B5F93_00660 [Odoribacter splanchnicus]|nr:hypothetical protein B5F93_00660 [Odoribacter splanchnicus]
MSCDCLKKKTTEADKIMNQARIESEIEKKDYVVYEEGNKTFYDRKSCWQKAGKPGKVRGIIFYLQ